MTTNAIRFKQLTVPRQQGEMARLKVVAGPDYGAVYVIVGAKATIGRGEDNDIVISDLKASRNHAEVSAGAGGWIVKDKGSANGILHNTKAVREAKLNIKDVITLGETTLEFTTSEASTQMLVAPPRSFSQIRSDAQNFLQQQQKLKKMGLSALFGGGDTPNIGAPQNKGRQLLLFGLVGAALFLLLSDGENKPKPAAKNKKDESLKNLAEYLPDSPVNRETNSLFKEGLREYFNGNFNRARALFETVLQIQPGHVLATIYLENCMKSVEQDVKLHLELGRKAFEAGKLRDSKAHFSRVMRLLYKDQTNPSYIEAKEQFEKVSKVMSGEAKT